MVSAPRLFCGTWRYLPAGRGGRSRCPIAASTRACPWPTVNGCQPGRCEYAEQRCGDPLAWPASVAHHLVHGVVLGQDIDNKITYSTAAGRFCEVAQHCCRHTPKVILVRHHRHIGDISVVRAYIVRDADQSYLRFPREHWTRVRHSNFIERTFGETRRRVKVIGRLPGEHCCLKLVWAVLDRASVNRNRNHTTRFGSHRITSPRSGIHIRPHLHRN